MPLVPTKERLQRIVVLNPKGGCGKTTLSTNLASYFARRGPAPILVDTDPAGYAMKWLEKRADDLPTINGVATYRLDPKATRSFQNQVPYGTRQLIIDTPASLDSPAIHNLTYDADSILIPIMPSPIDIRFAAQFIAELLLVAQLDRRDNQIAIVANRTRCNTKSLQKLMRFLNSLRIPVISVLRDSQNYVNAADMGMGVWDLPENRAGEDRYDVGRVARWLNRWQDRRHDSAPALEFTAMESSPEIILH